MAKRVATATENATDYPISLLQGDLADAWKDTDKAEKKAAKYIAEQHKKASEKIVNQSVGFVQRNGTYQEAKAGGKLNAYFDAVDDELKKMSAKQISYIDEESLAVFKRAYVGTSDAYGEAFGVSLGKVSKNTLAAFDTMPVLGASTKAETINQYSQLASRIRKDIAQSLLLGESPYKAGEKLSRSLGISRNHAVTLARTNIVAAHNRSTEVLASKNKDLFSGMRWITQLDERTCIVCGPRHGRIYPVGQAPYPAHFNCRCAVNPVPAYRIRRGLEAESTKRYNKEKNAWIKNGAKEDKRKNDNRINNLKKQQSDIEKRNVKNQKRLEKIQVENAKLAKEIAKTEQKTVKYAPVTADGVRTLKGGKLQTTSETKKQMEEIGFGGFRIKGFTDKDEALNRINLVKQDWTRVLNENPRLQKSLKGKQFCKLFNVENVVGTVNDSGKKVAGIATDTGRISVAAKKRLKKLTTSSINVGKVGNELGISATDMTGTARHEIGHMLSRSTWVQKGGEVELAGGVRGKVKSWNAIAGNKSAGWWKSNVSEYASTNTAEAFAESFSVYTAPGGREVLPTELRVYFDAVLRGK